MSEEPRMLTRTETGDLLCDRCQRFTLPKDMVMVEEAGCRCVWCIKLAAADSEIATLKEERARSRKSWVHLQAATDCPQEVTLESWFLETTIKLDRLEAAEAEVGRLKGHLLKHGQHRPNCKTERLNDEDWLYGSCDCGWSVINDALAPGK